LVFASHLQVPLFKSPVKCTLCVVRSCCRFSFLCYVVLNAFLCYNSFSLSLYLMAWNIIKGLKRFSSFRFDTDFLLPNVTNFAFMERTREVCGSLVGWGNVLQAGRLRVLFPMRSLDFFKSPNPCTHTMTLGSTKPPTEMSTIYLPGSKGRAGA
jgi:hypothetical protein